MKRNIHLILGPLLFLAIVLLIPESLLPFAIRGAIGTFLWMTLWWVFTPVHLTVTAFIPIVVNSLFGFVPVSLILSKYAHTLIILLIGANIITLSWQATGLNKRIALKSLSIIGNSVKQQLVVWFMLATVLSTFLPNIVVAATLSPIALSMLAYVNKGEVKKSLIATNILLAIAWGSGMGGFGTPLGGGMNLVAIGYIEEFTGSEYLFIDWVIRMMPILAVLTAATIIFMLTMKVETPELEGSSTFFKEEYHKLGKMSREEKFSALLFVIAVLLAFARPLYATILPSFTPPYAFLTLGLICFILPGKMNGRLLTFEYTLPKMSWGLYYLVAGGLALGTFITKSGTAAWIASVIGRFDLSGGLLSIMIFVFLAMLLANISSNTAACSIAIPIVISITSALNLSPIPYVYVTIVAANCAFILPTSTRAIPVGHGVDAKYMMKNGFKALLICYVIVCLFGLIFLPML